MENRWIYYLVIFIMMAVAFGFLIYYLKNSFLGFLWES